MTKQMKAAMAAMLMVGTLPMAAQQSQTDVVKVAPGQKKTTVIHRKNGSTDTVVSEGVGTGSGKRKTRRTGAKKTAKKTAGREPVEVARVRVRRRLEDGAARAG